MKIQKTIWRYPDLRSDLSEHAAEINNGLPWLESWRAVRSTLYCDYREPIDTPDRRTAKTHLEHLEADLAPQDLISEIEALVVNPGHDIRLFEDKFDNSSPEKREEACLRLESRAFKYGETIGATPALLDGFVARLFEQNYAPYRMAFGRGLKSGSVKPRETWLMLLGALRALDIKIFNYGVLSGALDELSKSDRPLFV